MTVRAVRRTATPSPMPTVELATNLADLAASADHLAIVAPATQETRHLIDRAVFQKVKSGVHLVNVARGSLVDQDALREALDDGRVARASLDVVDPEPLPAGHWLYHHPQVRISPHISWNMPGAIHELFDSFAVNLRHYIAGEPLEGIVDVEAGY
jgi:phosphoglycerate dehydrogenase-like enzyme